MAAQARRHTGQGYAHVSIHFVPRHEAPLPAERRNALPWLVAAIDGTSLLIAPWQARSSRGLSNAERDEIATVRAMLSRLAPLPKFAWVYPASETVSEMTPPPRDAWVRARLTAGTATQL
jgi:hypothetical protein